MLYPVISLQSQSHVGQCFLRMNENSIVDKLMDKSFDTSKHEWRWIAVLFLTAAVLFGISMSRTGFEGKDERRYAQVAKEITWGENIFVMHHLGKLYPDKPPLFFWMQAISYKVFGEVSPFSARVPLWIVSMLALAFSYLCVRQINGPRAALMR